jgi:hypothetical protein
MSDETEPKYGRGENPASKANLKMFGTEDANPQSQNAGGNKPWSIRNSIQFLARQEIDQNDGANAFKKILPKKPTVAQLIAANALAKATKSDMRAVEFVTDQVDGKLIQTNMNADYAALGNMSLEELREYRKRLEAKREELDGTGSGEAAGGGAAPRDIPDGGGTTA